MTTTFSPLTRWAYKQVSKHQRYHERKLRRSINYATYIARINLFAPLLDILPDGPRFWDWKITMGKGNRILIANKFLLTEPFMNEFTEWKPFTATLSITTNGDMTLDSIKFNPKIPDWLADNETQLWTILLDSLYKDDYD